ncbi:hypothetical protein [Acetobacter malorum]|uniref:hypothetical protein n=1 Tax=Acetobacter malorum TaxID=178901 RepID=UPI00248DA617|nr:hypothetical protein [Acetobacter malorum]
MSRFSLKDALSFVLRSDEPHNVQSLNLPKEADFRLDYDQDACQKAGEFILFSQPPHNQGRNKRRQVVNPAWASPYMLPTTVKPHLLPNFQKACAKGHATILIMGDSIFNAGAHLANPQQNPWEELLSAIKKANPHVVIEDYNQTWGAQTWAQMASAENAHQVPSWIDGKDGKKNWLQICIDKKPDLTFLYSGGNDAANLNPRDVDYVVKSFRSINSDVVLCETFQPSTGSEINNYWQAGTQDGVHFSRRYITTYAQTHDLPYLPFGRWGDMIRDGFDPEILAMPENNPQKDSAYPARYENVPDTALSHQKTTYFFPSIKNMLGVSADSCTDWCIAITHEGVNHNTTAWRIPLSIATLLGYDNSLWIIFDKDFLEFHVTDGAGNKKIYNTNIPTPRSKWSFWMMARGARLVFAMQLNYHSKGTENSIGLGYTKILDILVPRAGAPYQPYIATIGHENVILGQFAIDALCCADATCASGGGLRFRPSVTNRSLYYDTEVNREGHNGPWQPNAGGSDSYHMNNFGIQNLLYPVINAQDWSCSISTICIDSIQSSEGLLHTESLNAQGFLQSNSFLKANLGLSIWGASPLDKQPEITGTKSADPVTQQILAVLSKMGIVKDKTE